MKKTKITVIIVAMLLVISLSILLPFLIVSDVRDVPTSDEDLEQTINEPYISSSGQILTDNTGRGINSYIYPGEAKRFDIVNPDAGAYIVKILPNSNATSTFDFYTASGQLKSFYMQSDLSAGFNIKKEVDYFTLSMPASGMVGVLERVFSGTITIAGELPPGDLFAAIIDFENGARFVIEFYIGVYADSITLSESEVIF